MADCSAAKVGGGTGTARGSPGRRSAAAGSALCFAERGGRRAPDAAHRPGPAALPGAAGERSPLGDVSAGATAVMGSSGGDPSLPITESFVCLELNWSWVSSHLQRVQDHHVPSQGTGMEHSTMASVSPHTRDVTGDTCAKLRGGWTSWKIPLSVVRMLLSPLLTFESLFSI